MGCSPRTVGRHRQQRALLARAHRYAQLHADPLIAGRTHFFAAAALVSRTLWIYGPSAFLLRLSGTLEHENLARAAAIRAGTLYRGGSAEGNTREFIEVEQHLVQQALDALRAHDAAAYSREIGAANRALRWARRRVMRALIERPFVEALEAALAKLGSFDMAVRECRELLGLELAHAAVGYNAARTAGAIPSGSNTGVEQLFAVQANAAARGSAG